MKTNSKHLGLVTKKFNEFFFVDLINKENFGNSERFLCKVRKSINFKDQFIYVGDEVEIDNIDLTSKRAVIASLKKRQNLLNFFSRLKKSRKLWRYCKILMQGEKVYKL